MTRIKLAALLGLSAALLLPAWIRALDVPEGKAGVLEAVIGKVSVTEAGKTGKAKVGRALDFGALIETGPNGRVSLRHADNAVSRLAPNTELTLKAPGEKKGVFLSLKMGLIRFLVGKRAPGEVFEVSTANAVAAVKGTDAEVGTDGKTTKAAVFSSSREKALNFLSAVTGKSIDLAPGQMAGLDDKGFESRELNKADFENSQAKFKGLPKPEVKEGGEGDGGQGDGGGGGKKDGDEDKKDQAGGGDDEAFADAISDAFADVMNDMGLDDFLESDERTGDIVAGRIAYDRNGDRTQISSYVVGEGDTVVKATYAKREAGPFKGTSFAEESTTWNQDLPEDWASVANRALTAPDNLDATGYPIYFKAKQNFLAGNPQGDLMKVLRDYEVPYYDPSYQGGIFVRGALQTSQGFSQGLYLNGTPVQYVDWLGDADSIQTNFPGSDTLVSDQPSYDPNNSWVTNSTYGNPVGGHNADGSFSLVYSFYDDTDIFLQTDVAVLTQGGVMLDTADLVDTGSPQTMYLRNFRGLDNSLDIELTFRSVLLSAPIDLLVIPTIFDQMDFYDLPRYDSGGG